MEEIHLLPGATPFYYPGNHIGCLVLHGFTGIPQEVRWLGQYLNQRGYTVHGPLLAGHGTTIRDMSQVHWREWYASALAGYAMLRDQCEAVFALGLSMGGALALLLASREPIAGVITMSAVCQIRDWRRSLVPILALFVSAVPKGKPEKDEFDERVRAEQRARGEEPIGHISYTAYPVRPVVQLDRMLAELRASLVRVTAPALLMHSKQDEVVAFENLQWIYNAISSTEKRQLVLENSRHVITEDVEREIVFAAAADFVAEHS